MTMFVDIVGDSPATPRCVCTLECEHPCVFRLGVSKTPCCPGCPPLPDPCAEAVSGDERPLK